MGEAVGAASNADNGSVGTVCASEMTVVPEHDPELAHPCQMYKVAQLDPECAYVSCEQCGFDAQPE